MGENSKIEWCDHTFNPWLGCTKISSGCKHCYAETLMDKRWRRVEWGPTGERKRTSQANWRKPLMWNKQAAADGRRDKIFCASLADVFEHKPDQPELDEWRADLFSLIINTPHLDWLLLTKRPELVNATVERVTGFSEAATWFHAAKNAWVGTSVENQKAANKRIPHLLLIPATVLYLSLEPLLGPVDLTRVKYDGVVTIDSLNGLAGWPTPHQEFDKAKPVNLAIIGGESGPNARLMNIHWATDIVEQCQAAGVKVFVKQLGSNPAKRILEPLKVGNWLDKKPIVTPLKLKDSKGGDWDEWPEELRVREMPEVGNGQNR